MKRLLYVEDDLKNHCQIHTAKDAAEAIGLLTKENFLEKIRSHKSF